MKIILVFAEKDGNKSHSVIIVVPIIAFVVIIISYCIYLRARKQREKPKSKLINYFIVIDVLQIFKKGKNLFNVKINIICVTLIKC